MMASIMDPQGDGTFELIAVVSIIDAANIHSQRSSLCQGTIDRHSTRGEHAME